MLFRRKIYPKVNKSISLNAPREGVSKYQTTKAIIAQQKGYGSGSGTASRAALVLAITENNYCADNREFACISVGPQSEATSACSCLMFGTRSGSTMTERVSIDNRGHLTIGAAGAWNNCALNVHGSIYMPAGNNITWSNGNMDILGGPSGSVCDLIFRTWTGSSLTEKLRITGGGTVDFCNSISSPTICATSCFKTGSSTSN